MFTNTVNEIAHKPAKAHLFHTHTQDTTHTDKDRNGASHRLQPPIFTNPQCTVVIGGKITSSSLMYNAQVDATQ